MKSTAWKFFALVLAAYLLTMGGHLYSPDEEILFRATQSIAERRTFAIQPLPADFGTRTGIDGRQYPQYGLGQPILALPFYYTGKIIAAILPPAHDFWKSARITFAEAYHGNARGDDGSYWLRFGVSLFNPVVAAILATVIYLFCFLLTREQRASLLTAGIYAFGTMAWVHSKPFFTETLAALCLLLAFYFIAREHRPHSLYNWFWAGCFAGLAVFVRLDSIMAYPGLILFYFLSNRRSIDPERAFDELIDMDRTPAPGSKLHSDFWKRTVVTCVPLAAFALLLLGINYSLYGNPFATGYADQPEGVKFSTPLYVGLYGFLFSIGKGFFFFSPPLLLFFFAINRFWKEQRSLAASLVLSVLCFLLVQSTWQNWGGGWCWGPRHIFQLNALLVIPIVSLMRQWHRIWIRWSAIGLMTAGVLVQLYGCSQSFIDFYFYGFRRIEVPPTTTLQYNPATEAPLLIQHYLLLTRNEASNIDSAPAVKVEYPTGKSEKMKPDPFFRLPPPLSHSFYILEHSTWAGYKALWRYQRKHDFFWLWLAGLKPRPIDATEQS